MKIDSILIVLYFILCIFKSYLLHNSLLIKFYKLQLDLSKIIKVLFLYDLDFRFWDKHLCIFDCFMRSDYYKINFQITILHLH